MADRIEQGILDDIDEYGWSAIIVAEDDKGPGFEYSIGIQHTLDHPELIIFGLRQKTSHAILWSAFRAIQGGASFSGGMKSDDLLEKIQCAFRVVSEPNHEKYLGYAMWHRRHVGKIGTLEALQIVWPDEDGLFPWETGVDERCRDAQPKLWNT